VSDGRVSGIGNREKTTGHGARCTAGDEAGVASFAPRIVAYSTRESARESFRKTFPRRRATLVFARSAEELTKIFHRDVVDAVVIDIQPATPDVWRAIALADEFPSAAFFAVAPYLAAEGPVIARCGQHDICDIISEGIDDSVMRALVLRSTFSARFSRAFASPPAELALSTPVQLSAWRMIVERPGRTVHTAELAKGIGVTREHLSRTFATDGAPNLKRVVDLVRLFAAAELAKNPGYDASDIAEVLKFASPSHLSTMTHRLAGIRPAGLARLRAVDLIRRFGEGRGRSRG
jgi:AraC-like DNA-binding protein